MADTTEDKFKQAIGKKTLTAFVISEDLDNDEWNEEQYDALAMEKWVRLSDVLAVYAETQRDSAEQFRQHKQQLQNWIRAKKRNWHREMTGKHYDLMDADFEELEMLLSEGLEHE